MIAFYSGMFLIKIKDLSGITVPIQREERNETCRVFLLHMPVLGSYHMHSPAAILDTNKHGYIHSRLGVWENEGFVGREAIHERFQ